MYSLEGQTISFFKSNFSYLVQQLYPYLIVNFSCFTAHSYIFQYFRKIGLDQSFYSTIMLYVVWPNYKVAQTLSDCTHASFFFYTIFFYFCEIPGCHNLF